MDGGWQVLVPLEVEGDQCAPDDGAQDVEKQDRPLGKASQEKESFLLHIVHLSGRLPRIFTSVLPLE